MYPVQSAIRKTEQKDPQKTTRIKTTLTLQDVDNILFVHGKHVPNIVLASPVIFNHWSTFDLKMNGKR